MIGTTENNEKTAEDDHEEDFLSLVPADDDGAAKGQTKVSAVSDGEDFISLMPVDAADDDDDEEATNRDNNGASENDSIEKRSNERQRTFDRFKSLPPWMETYVDYRRVNPLVALHNEIVSFCRLMEPRKDEMKTREDLVAKFTALAKSTFQGKCKVEVFGSQVTGYVNEIKPCLLYREE
jgi:hypothetical protein